MDSELYEHHLSSPRGRGKVPGTGASGVAGTRACGDVIRFGLTLDPTGTHVADAGWEVGIVHAGHTLGEFPHERIDGDRVTYYVTTGSDQPMRRTDSAGRDCHWILELHLVDRERGFGGFYEQLITVD